MKTNLKPAGAKVWAIFEKLQALAERGIDGERSAAQGKIARLKARFDFSTRKPSAAPDLFFGNFKPSAKARRIFRFGRGEFDVANSVKWAIESGAKIPCVFRDTELLAEAAPGTVRRLEDIAAHIALHFRSLIGQFSAFEGVSVSDRAAFVMGLYDGMMNETRPPGQALPRRPRAKKTRKGQKPKAAPPEVGSGLNVHPYAIALGLGRQIRFSAPLSEITAELEAAAPKHLANTNAAVNAE